MEMQNADYLRWPTLGLIPSVRVAAQTEPDYLRWPTLGLLPGRMQVREVRHTVPQKDPDLAAARCRLVRTLTAVEEKERRQLAAVFGRVAEKCWSVAKVRR